MKITAKIDDLLGRLLQEMTKYGTVGVINTVAGVATFNLCRAGLDLAPVQSTVIACTVAMLVAYLGHRHWTYRDRDRDRIKRYRELLLFVVFNSIGLAIQSGVLAISHYVLGLHSLIADNIACNVIGFGLGTLFRFWAYRTWVFPEPQPTISAVRLPETEMGTELSGLENGRAGRPMLLRRRAYGRAGAPAILPQVAGAVIAPASFRLAACSALVATAQINPQGQHNTKQQAVQFSTMVARGRERKERNPDQQSLHANPKIRAKRHGKGAGRGM